MTRRLHPPTHLLRAFVLSARLGTISAAADALSLTQSAVSRQIIELEGWLGVPLFVRVRKRLSLTPTGQRYLAATAPLLQQLERATLEAMSSVGGGDELHVSVLPTFNARWLIPRLPRLKDAHPKLTLQFVPFAQGYDFTRPDLDCAIRYGQGPWPGALADYLIGRELSLIAPPPRADRPALEHPDEVKAHRLLQHVSVPWAWTAWCEAMGVQGVNPHAGTQLDQYATIIRAVAAGMGLGLVPTFLVHEELARGEVVTPPWGPFEPGDASAGYFLCYPESKALLPALQQFRTWLLNEAAPAPARRVRRRRQPA
jgi:LysR family transcriptional regulator, glycine cleavage system transcriptional activator